MRTMHLTIILLVGLLSCACNRATPIKPQPQQRQDQALDPELEMETDGEMFGENRRDVRRAAADYIKNTMPGWTIRGTASFPYTGTLYIAGVDLQSGGKRQTMNLVVRLFVSPDGKTYWKADAVSPQLVQALSAGYARKKYQELDDELERQQGGGLN